MKTRIACKLLTVDTVFGEMTDHSYIEELRILH